MSFAMPGGTPRKRPPLRQRLTERLVRTVRPGHPDAPASGIPAKVIYWDTTQGGLGLKVMPSGGKSYVVVYRVPGWLHPRWYSLGKADRIGLREARAAARRILARVALGEDPQADRFKSRHGESLAQVHALYLEGHARPRNKSWRQGEKLMRKYILPSLGDRRIAAITQDDLRRVFDGLTGVEGRPILANQVLAAASAVLSWAAARPYIDVNVARGIQRNPTKRRERYLSDAEVAAAWPDFARLGLARATVLRLILATAQRPGEVVAMRWRDVDLEDRVWTLPGGADGGWPGTKNGKTHRVPLGGLARELLGELGAQLGAQFGAKREGFVFPGQGAPHRARVSAGPVWRSLGLPLFRAHDLRATAASGMDRLGVAREHIGRVLNHGEGQVTAGYIRHGAEKQKRRALELWDERLRKIISGGPAQAQVREIDRPAAAGASGPI